MREEWEREERERGEREREKRERGEREREGKRLRAARRANLCERQRALERGRRERGRRGRGRGRERGCAPPGARTCESASERQIATIKAKRRCRASEASPVNIE